MDDKDYIIELNKTIGTLTAKIEDFCDTLTKHEIRIINLEKKQTECTIKEQCIHNKKENLKDDLLKLLAKGLIIAILSICSLTGASGLLLKIFGG
jgi:hypothetical protein